MARKFYFGVDVGGTFTKFALMDEKCRAVGRAMIPSEGFSNKAFFAKSLKEEFERLLAQGGIGRQEIRGAGVGLPGPVDFEQGIVLSLTNIKGWSRFPLASFLKKFFRVPVVIDNDANCMALAEVRLGAAKGASSALCVTLGTGVGGGLILDGEILRGDFFFGGEVGHIPIAADGPACSCGGSGCLERYVGNRILLARVKEIFGRKISLEEAGRMARMGNRMAQTVWREAGEKIGFALAGVFNVFNPRVIVVGGGVAGAGGVLLDAIRLTLRRHAMRQLKSKVVVRKALLGLDAGVLGAALAAKEGAEKGICS